MKKFLICILLILLVFPKHAYSIRIRGFDMHSPLITRITYGITVVIYGASFCAANQVENFGLAGAIIAGGVGTTCELGFTILPIIKTYINKNQHPRAAVPLKISQAVIGYTTGKASEIFYLSRIAKKDVPNILPEIFAHGFKGLGKASVKNVPSLVPVYFNIPDSLNPNNLLPTIILSVLGEGVGTLGKSLVQGKGRPSLEDIGESLISSGFARVLVNKAGEAVVGWNPNPFVGVFSELTVYRIKRLFPRSMVKISIDDEIEGKCSILEVPLSVIVGDRQSLEFLDLPNPIECHIAQRIPSLYHLPQNPMVLLRRPYSNLIRIIQLIFDVADERIFFPDESVFWCNANISQPIY